MPLSPLCLVNNGISFVPTENGVDVSPGATVSIRLAQTTGVATWLLQVTGTDELTAVPTLTGVSPSAQVTSPSTIVTFQFPPRPGSALGFRSDVQGAEGHIATTFGVYSRTTSGNARVGFVTETREGNTTYGWAAKINPVIRASGQLVIEAPHNKHMPALLTTGAGGELACATGLVTTPHPSSALAVSVNGILVTDIGYGSTANCACYWSTDGVVAKTRQNVAQNDRLFWNGVWAEFNLSPTDYIDFWYDAAI